ncbi:MAG: YetF domain-containing protein [Caldimonas sp.]
MSMIFFDGWPSLARTFVIGVLAYVGLVFFLRVSGKRTLSKMNAFDFVVTVSLGSTLATVLLNRSVPLADGLTAFAVLIALQFGVTWLSVRVGWLRRFMTGEPQMLFYRGAFLAEPMRACRVTQAEVLAAIRSSGHLDLSKVGAVVFETDASLSIIDGTGAMAHSSLGDVKDVPHG